MIFHYNVIILINIYVNFIILDLIVIYDYDLVGMYLLEVDEFMNDQMAIILIF